MTDTLVLAQLDLQKSSLSLVSIPRDLYYKNRKINSIYRAFGIERLLAVLSEAMGIPIEKYISIDMYGFIDVINLLGGIDVDLPEDLVDPTYRVRESGAWSTLYYPAGRHHLSGIEVLRIVRSRYLTSDFGRAERQQIVLKGILQKIKDLRLTDLSKLYQLITILRNYIETNLHPLEILGYLTRGPSIQLEKTLVLSLDNVLYADYENLKLAGLKEEEVEESFDKGAYILLPLEEDWSFFSQYIKDFLEIP
ncbi:MAG: LCP family protein [Spirochaetales bacterium]